MGLEQVDKLINKLISPVALSFTLVAISPNSAKASLAFFVCNNSEPIGGSAWSISL